MSKKQDSGTNTNTTKDLFIKNIVPFIKSSIESAGGLENFLATYPQPYPQAGQGVGGRADRQQPTPPVAESGTGGPYTPQQKIFAKVKAAI